MERPVASAVLKNEEWEQGSIRNVVVAPFAHRNSLVEIVTAEKGLPQLSNIAFALQLDSELLPNCAGSAVTSRQIRSPNRFLCGVIRLDDSGHRVCVLREINQFAATAHVRSWNPPSDRSHVPISRAVGTRFAMSSQPPPI